MNVYVFFILLAMICFLIDFLGQFLWSPKVAFWTLGWAFVMAALITTGSIAVR